MNNKISQKDRSLLFIVLGIVIVGLAWVLGFNKFQTATESLESENETLEQSISNLQELKNNQSFYESETERFESENEEIKASFPSQILNADEVLYAKKLEEAYMLQVSNITMSETVGTDVAYPTASLMDENGANYSGTENPNGLYMYGSSMELTFDGGYTDIKSMLSSIVNDKQPKSIEEVDLSFNDTTGNISGTLYTTLYTLAGNGVEYTRPDFSGVTKGTDDIFNSFDQASKVSDVENDENSENGENGTETAETTTTTTK